MTSSSDFSLTVPAGTQVRRAPIPPTRDPFVNAPFIFVKTDEHGVEWRWISTWNSTSGTIGALVSELGEFRLYRFPPRHPGFYSAVATDDDTLWLCGWLDRVVRLTLSSGDFQEYPTGAPENALVFEGMAYDPATGKLFAAAYPYTNTTAFSFDTQACAAVKVYEDISPAHYMRHAFANGDGSYSIMLECPEPAILRWNPVIETLADTGVDACDYFTVADDQGRRYLRGQGWYDPLTGIIHADGPVPDRECTWFARRGDTVYGTHDFDAGTEVTAWALASGTVTTVCRLPDIHGLNVSLTASGHFVAVSMYGIFYRCDLHGTLEMSRVLPSDSVGHVDCVRRIDEDRLLGTPFITQRFWEVNLRTGAGYDCGRAAPSSGEVLRTWQIGGKVYMAAYGGGELVEYDPAAHPHFPENPRTVADAPGGMRPVADADDGRNIFYACSAEYGHLGSTLTRYDTVTGLATYAVNPLPEQQISTLAYDPATKLLLAGTTNSADCASCPPSTDQCFLAQFDPETLAVRASFVAPMGATCAQVQGPLDGGRWLCTLHPTEQWFALDGAAFTPVGELAPLPEGVWRIIYAGKPGKILFRIANRLELWDMNAVTRMNVVAAGNFYNAVVQEGTLYLFRHAEIVVVDGFTENL